jgi:uncharacterized RmlC-like cupin family protein
MLREPQIARFRELTPMKKTFEVQGIAIPEAAHILVAARDNVVLMEAESEDSGRAAIRGPAGIRIFMSTCPPGQGPALHLHPSSTETFLALTGRWKIAWGDLGEHAVVIEPFDVVCVPPGWYRAFTNVGTREATLMVMVNYDPTDPHEDTLTSGDVGARIRREFGPQVIEAFGRIGIRFEGESR